MLHSELCSSEQRGIAPCRERLARVPERDWFFRKTACSTIRRSAGWNSEEGRLVTHVPDATPNGGRSLEAVRSFQLLKTRELPSPGQPECVRTPREANGNIPLDTDEGGLAI